MIRRPITPSEINEIRELVPIAKLKRRQHGENDPHTVASNALTALLKLLFEEGATFKELSRATGLTYHSVRARVYRGTEKDPYILKEKSKKKSGGSK